MFSKTVPKKRKNEIKYLIKGLVNDLELQRVVYHKVCNDKIKILKNLLEEWDGNVLDSENVMDSVGSEEFDKYMSALTRVKNRLDSSEKRFDDDMEEAYYKKRLKKCLKNEADQSSYLLSQYNLIKDVFPFFDDSIVLFNITVREIKRKKLINELITKAINF